MKTANENQQLHDLLFKLSQGRRETCHQRTITDAGSRTEHHGARGKSGSRAGSSQYAGADPKPKPSAFI